MIFDGMKKDVENMVREAIVVPKEMIGPEDRETVRKKGLYYGTPLINEKTIQVFRSFSLALKHHEEIMLNAFNRFCDPGLKYYFMKKRNGHRYKKRVIKKWINRDLKKARLDKKRG